MSREVSVKTVTGRGVQGSTEGRCSEEKKRFLFVLLILWSYFIYL